MGSPYPTQQRIGDFYADVVLPALADRLDAAFPEFGWKRDARGWVATNEEMTHRVLGVRAERVVAHWPAPRGFLVHGGDATLWTAYLNGGALPRGEEFVRSVKEIAERAGVDPSPIDQPRPLDRRTELFNDFFALCGAELASARGSASRAYLERRGIPPSELQRTGLGTVPDRERSERALLATGYSGGEITQAGVLADLRWPGRILGAWRDERGSIGTLWARSLGDSDATRYLYLRGAGRTELPPYGLSEVLRLPPTDRRDVVLVEGLMDVHHLRATGFPNVAAVGGTRLQARALSRLGELGFQSVVLAFDNDAPGRDGVSRAVEGGSRAKEAPTLRVLEPKLLGDSKDPDTFVRKNGIEKFRALVDRADCGVTWRALELTHGVTPQDDAPARRTALARAGHWLGTLPAGLALEQEDAVRRVADQCGYSSTAVERAFRARFWHQHPRTPGRTQARVIER